VFLRDKCIFYLLFSDNKFHQPLCLMSSSMDKTIVIWRFDNEAGVWMDDVSTS
jgi:hypothetical protein